MPGLTLGLKEVRLLFALYWGHHHGERETDAAARLLSRLPELPQALISHRFALDDAPSAFVTSRESVRAMEYSAEEASAASIAGSNA